MLPTATTIERSRRCPTGRPIACGARIGLYDFVIELDHNTRPRVARRGSAVFIHVARVNLSPTAGCVALPAPALRRLLVQIARNTVIEIG